jgi:dTDP-glucose 4,6-dehydratase
MAILVTGGLGFLGVNLLKRFAMAGEDVISLDISSPDDQVHRFLESLISRVTFYQGDTRDNQLLSQIVQNHHIDTIIHGAAVTATSPESEKRDFAETVNVNILGVTRVLEVSRHVQALRKLIYVSSASVYGPSIDPTHLIKEDDAIFPNRLYPLTKRTAEFLCLRHSEIYNTNLVILRISSLYGPMERRTSARQTMSTVCDYVHRALNGEDLVTGALNHFRDFTYVDDVTEAFLKVLAVSDLPHSLYNRSSGRSYRIEDVLEAVRKHIPEVRCRQSDGGVPGGYAADPGRGPLDISLARKDFGFAPVTSLEEGVGKYIRWLRKGFLSSKLERA